MAFSSNFYETLFDLSPEVRPLFKEDIKVQGDKLMKMLGIIINNLYELENIGQQITSLGNRHVSYGVKPQYYNTVGTALLKAIEQQLGAQSSPQILDAWKAVFDTIAKQMQLTEETNE